jgi:hypothetical protein
MIKFLPLLILGLLFSLPTASSGQVAETIQQVNDDAEQVLAKVEQLKAQNQAKIDAAFAAMEAVQKAGAYIESLSDLFSDGIVTLPVGIKKGDYELIIQKITQDKKTGKSFVHASCAFKFKDDGQKIAFEGSAVLEGQKGLGTSGYLQLITPVRRNIGKQGAIVFNAGTKVNFGCEGIESFLAKINLIVTSSQIVPVDKTGKPAGKHLSTTLEASFYDFDNFTVSFSFNQSFSLKGLKDVIFTLKGATLDQSDLETSAMVQFPENYLTSTNVEEKKLWKGIAITEASIALPAIFKKPPTAPESVPSVAPTTPAAANTPQTPVATSIQDRILLNLNKVLIDDNGFTGDVSAKDIYSSSVIDQSKWDITVTDFELAIFKNEITGMGFGGDINMPPLGKNSLMPYGASYNQATEEYEFQVGVKGTYEFPVLRSTLTLDETSFIEVLFRDADIYPSLNASGVITVDAPVGSDGGKKFSVPDISFQNMCISRESPYFSIGAIGVTGNLTSPKVAGFELSVTDIKTFKDTVDSGLSFDAGIKLNDMFGGSAGLKLYGDYAKWKFNRVGIDKVNVNFQSASYSVKGGVMFKNGDALYGTGFRGDLKFTVIDKFTFDAVGVFGKKDDYRYFLTDVFYETSPTSGIVVPPALSFYGVGGGLYSHMQQSSAGAGDSEFGKSLSGISYTPDKKVGMGFMAATKFGLVGSSAAFNAKVGFEMQFNDYGGVNFIQLRGDAAFMNDPLKMGSLAENIKSQTQKLAAAGGKLKLAAPTDLGVPENKSSGILTASMNIKYDLAHSIFSADLSTYLNAGFIKGVGENNRMGWASAYFSKDKWYTYVGTPTDPLGIDIAGLAQAKAYFMVGDDIPELPLPPPEVLENFSADKQRKLSTRNSDNLASGSGIAFGSSLSLKFKATLPPFYASLGVGMGAEFMLKNYGVNAYCAGSNPPLGINGWYAQAQAWAYVNADIGIECTVFWTDYRLSILNMSASALMAGAGPNPYYFTGNVGGRFSVMGGLVSGQCDFGFEIGEKCKVMGGSPFGVDVIAQLTPDEGAKEVNVFAAPQAVLNIPVGLEMKVEEDDGQFAMYKVILEAFDVKYKTTGQAVAGLRKNSTDGKTCMLDPDEPFESNKEMLVHAKVSFLRSADGNSWTTVNGANGQPLYEEKTASFVSGERPKEILPEHVKYSYPVARQYNYHPDEYRNGYVMVTENYAYLFTTEKPVGFNQMLRLTNVDGNKQETSFTHKTFAAGNDIRFEINFSTQGITFAPDEIYKMAIVNVPQQANAGITSNITTTQSNLGTTSDVQVQKQKAEGTLAMLEEKEIYGLHFRTSKYNTFKDKMAVFDIPETGSRSYVEPFVHNIKANLYETEYFDAFEMPMGNGFTPLIQFEALLDKTDWYNESFYKDMYKDCQLDGIKTMRKNGSDNFEGLGYPPKEGVWLFNSMGSRSLSDDEIATGTSLSISPEGVLVYSVPFWSSRDFFYQKNVIAEKIANKTPLSKTESLVISKEFPPMVKKGDYPVLVKYVLPGKKIISSSVEVRMNNPL